MMYVIIYLQLAQIYCSFAVVSSRSHSLLLWLFETFETLKNNKKRPKGKNLKRFVYFGVISGHFLSINSNLLVVEAFRMTVSKTRFKIFFQKSSFIALFGLDFLIFRPHIMGEENHDLFIFRPHIMGEENHDLCCVFLTNSAKSPRSPSTTWLIYIATWLF